MTGAVYDARTARLVRARRTTAQHKQQQAIEALRRLEDAGIPVNVTSVARAGQVSTWFIYNNITVRAAVEDAVRRRATVGPQHSRSLVPDDRTEQGLRVDLSGARDEIRALREERTQLRRRLERSLGERVDKVDSAELLVRFADLALQNSVLVAELAEARRQLAQTVAEAHTAHEEVAGARSALRRMMAEVPRR